MTPENTLGDARYAPLRPLRTVEIGYRTGTFQTPLRARENFEFLGAKKSKSFENRALRAPWNPLSADENPDFALALQKIRTPPK